MPFLSRLTLMRRYLSPTDIQEMYRVGKTTAFKLLKQFEENGGEVIHIGKLRRVSEEQFTEFLKRGLHEKV